MTPFQQGCERGQVTNCSMHVVVPRSSVNPVATGGKSLTFQLPVLLRDPGVTVVVSPVGLDMAAPPVACGPLFDTFCMHYLMGS